MTLVASTLIASPPDFSAFDQRAQAGKRCVLFFLGGSLTWGAQATDPQKTSYRALVSQNSKRPTQSALWFHDAAIGGTGSQLAAFRLVRMCSHTSPIWSFWISRSTTTPTKLQFAPTGRL